MKGKLLIEGKEFEVEVEFFEEDYKRVIEKKKTGYERVEVGEEFYYVAASSKVEFGDDDYVPIDDKYYDISNYYSSKEVAENNARADKLMRQLRRFAAENREKEINWNDVHYKKYCIYYDYGKDNISLRFFSHYRDFGILYFDSQETAQAAIDEFHDELIWYFTEYKDSL